MKEKQVNYILHTKEFVQHKVKEVTLNIKLYNVAFSMGKLDKTNPKDMQKYAAQFSRYSYLACIAQNDIILN
jgi:hypothetical protein